MQEARNLVVSRVPGHVTTLVRFTALRSLDLLCTDALLPAEVSFMIVRFLRHQHALQGNEAPSFCISAFCEPVLSHILSRCMKYRWTQPVSRT